MRTGTPGISDHCGICDAILNPHNVTGLCAECKLDARNARLDGTIGRTLPDTLEYLDHWREPVALADALAAVATAFGGAPFPAIADTKETQ